MKLDFEGINTFNKIMSLKSAASPISTSNLSGKNLSFLGIVFVAVSMFLVWKTNLLKVNLLEVSQVGKVENWILAAITAMFFLVGVLIIITGIKDAARIQKVNSLRRRNPSSPWLWDYEWKSGKKLTRTPNSFASNLLGICFISIFHIVGWKVASQHHFTFPTLIFPIGITAFTLLVLLIMITNWRRRNAHQRVKISLNEFPLLRGSTIKIQVAGLEKSKMKSLEATVESIREDYTFRKDRRSVKCQVVEKFEKKIPVHSNILELEFEIPKETLPSKLSQRPAVFWELHLFAKCQGPDLDKRVFLPIY